MPSSMKPPYLMLFFGLLLSSFYMASAMAEEGLYYVTFKTETDGDIAGTGQFNYDPVNTSSPGQATLTIIDWPTRPEFKDFEMSVTVYSETQHDDSNQPWPIEDPPPPAGPSRVRGINGSKRNSDGGTLLSMDANPALNSRGTWAMSFGGPQETGVYLIRNAKTVTNPIPEPPVVLLILAGLLPLAAILRRRRTLR